MEKVYTPTVIPDAPFPSQDTPQPQTITQQSANTTYTPATIADNANPTQRIATDIIGNVLNTKNRKIIKELQFTPSGALQIGDFTKGQTGDVRISPDGIVARDKTGSTTFVLDGDSGDATFAGQLQTGAVVAGQVAVGDDAIQLDGNNRRIIIYDTNNIPSIVIGQA